MHMDALEAEAVLEVAGRPVATPAQADRRAGEDFMGVALAVARASTAGQVVDQIVILQLQSCLPVMENTRAQECALGRTPSRKREGTLKSEHKGMYAPSVV